LGEGLPDAVSGFINSSATRRVKVADATGAEFKAAVFSDGSVFGEPEWTERLVQDRRACYQETIIALQSLREAKTRGTPREQLEREFSRFEREEFTREFPTVPKFGLFDRIVRELQQKPRESDEDSLSKDIDRLELMMLEFDKRLLDSKPPITDQPVKPGQPLS
jgi:hypothetical protein